MILKDPLYIALLATVAGMVSTGAGGVLALILGGRSLRFISFILEFSGGLMLAIVCFDLLPDALSIGSMPICVAGLFCGVVMAVFLQGKVKYDSGLIAFGKEGLLGTGFFIMAGIALHNFPEGLAIGSGFDLSLSLGLSLLIVISLHNVAEGLSMALPFKMSGLSKTKIVLYPALSGLPIGLGAVIGAFFGKLSPATIQFSLALAGGAMLYIVCGDIIPESKSLYRGRISAIGNAVGFILGMIMSITL